MKITLNHPAREFTVGRKNHITVRDCGTAALEPNELITFLFDGDQQYDFAAKDWGFYATPSVNGRLKDQGFKTALVRNSLGRHYVMVVSTRKMDLFEKYCRDEQQTVVSWLDEQ